MAKNDYQARQQAMLQGFVEVAEDLGRQQMWDFFQLTLRDPNVMGKDTFGPDRLEKIYENLKVLVNRYHICFTDDKEADYYQEELDSLLKPGCTEFYPFYERYPMLKQYGYQKARKGWK